MTDDAELLRQYAQNGSETAFAELVGRHLPLVYSAALRQMHGDAAAAKDVAQTVFVDLARKANTLLDRELLAGWLYTSTRLAASMAIRGDQRRQRREQIAVAMAERTTEPESPQDLGDLKLVLDDAISELGAGERNAVLIRYFQGKELKEVGAALGISEDAARMRVTRALGKLQGLLKERGVTISAAALGTALITETAAAVPAGLAASISAAALTSATVTAAATTTKAIAMTTLQKTAIAATIALAAGTGIYEARHASTLRHQIQALQEQQSPLADQIQQLQREKDEVATRLTVLADEMERTKGNSRELLKLRGEVSQLRAQRIEANHVRAEIDRISNGPPIFVFQDIKSPLLALPSTNDVVRTVNAQMLAQRKARELDKLGVLKRKLALSPEQEQGMRDLLMSSVEDEMKARTASSFEELAALGNPTKRLEERIRGLLSPEQQLAYEEFQQGNVSAKARVAASAELMKMQDSLGFTQEEQTRVFDGLLRQQPLEAVLSPSQLQTYRDYVQRHTVVPK